MKTITTPAPSIYYALTLHYGSHWYTMIAMKRKQKIVRIDDEQHAALKAIQKRDGVSIAEQVRRAVDKHIKQKVMAPMAQE